MFIDPCVAARLPGQQQHGVGLWFVLVVDAKGAVVAKHDARQSEAIRPEPRHDVPVRETVIFDPHGRGHLNDSVNQLGVFDERHGEITAMKLSGVQAVAVAQTRGRLDFGDVGAHLKPSPRPGYSFGFGGFFASVTSASVRFRTVTPRMPATVL